METIRIRQATKKGYVEVDKGGCFDISVPTSKTRRGRVIDRGKVCGTLMTSEDKAVYEGGQYRIRKLTPKECWRLMGFSDEDFHKAEAVNSNTQLYKQAGNSIVKQVLMAIFKEML